MTHCRGPQTVLLACSLSVFGAGCTTLRTVSPAVTPAQEPFPGLTPGDELVLTLADGRRVEIELERIEGDVIVSGEAVRYARGEIVTVQARHISTGKTALAVAGLVAGAYATLMAVVGLLFTGVL